MTTPVSQTLQSDTQRQRKLFKEILNTVHVIRQTNGSRVNIYVNNFWLEEERGLHNL